jgi:SAM-dependent methyltransferase
MMDKKENQFWNNRQNIKWFNNYPSSGYWIKFLRGIKNRSKQKVLDLGCGAGRHTRLLQELGFDVYACDRHSGMVYQTQENMGILGWSRQKTKKRIIKQSMDNLSYRNNFFDLVICHGVYHNAFNFKIFEKSISETSRILKKGGQLLFNIFTDELHPKDIKIIDKNKYLYLTKEGLRIVLISPDKFLGLALKNNLIPINAKNLIRYETNVSTGKRAVFRGILTKK